MAVSDYIVQLFGSHPSAGDAPMIFGAHRWSVCTSYTRIKHQACDVIFDLHGNEIIKKAGIEQEYADLATQGRRFVLLEPSPWLPDATIYPLDFIRQRFGGDEPESSFASSMDYMIAYAIAIGATWIDVQGVDMRHHAEYTCQRETFAYWKGQARGRGIRFTVPRASGLDGVHTLYGYNLATGLPGPPGETVALHGHPAELVRA